MSSCWFDLINAIGLNSAGPTSHEREPYGLPAARTEPAVHVSIRNVDKIHGCSLCGKVLNALVLASWRRRDRVTVVACTLGDDRPRASRRGVRACFSSSGYIFSFQITTPSLAHAATQARTHATARRPRPVAAPRARLSPRHARPLSLASQLTRSQHLRFDALSHKGMSAARSMCRTATLCTAVLVAYKLATHL
eukprot:2319328-Pleurochrysis_carterae.AAC.1